jgi:hypothetical protein
MIKTEAEAEENDHADDFGPRVQTVNPGIFIQIKKDVHAETIIAKLALDLQFLPPLRGKGQDGG